MTVPLSVTVIRLLAPKPLLVTPPAQPPHVLIVMMITLYQLMENLVFQIQIIAHNWMLMENVIYARENTIGYPMLTVKNPVFRKDSWIFFMFSPQSSYIFSDDLILYFKNYFIFLLF